MPEFNGLNTPVYRASTLVFNNTRDFLQRSSRMLDGFSYGLYGTPTGRVLERQIADLEGGEYCMLLPSGLAAVTHPMLALLKQGDHVLLADCVYGPTRDLCTTMLAAYGITHSFFPSDAGTIEPWLNDRTRLVVIESPGSYTMEIQDIAPLCAQAHRYGAQVLMDNAWGLGRINAFEHGVDVVCTALSKYASGHSDVCLGACTVRDRGLFEHLKMAFISMGTGVSADDAYLVSRGMQTLQVRLDEHARRALAVAELLQDHPAVAHVFHPALPADAQHARYLRYFSGSNGLISLTLHETHLERIEKAIDSLRLFQIGASWGGTHSLVALANLANARSAVPWQQSQWIVRLHIGLEPFESIKDDLFTALQTLLND